LVDWVSQGPTYVVNAELLRSETGVDLPERFTGTLNYYPSVAHMRVLSLANFGGTFFDTSNYNLLVNVTLVIMPTMEIWLRFVNGNLNGLSEATDAIALEVVPDPGGYFELDFSGNQQGKFAAKYILFLTKARDFSQVGLNKAAVVKKAS